MLQDVLKVRTLEHRWLVLDFENGETRRFDMQPLLDQKPWVRIKPAALFERVFVENGTVAWPGNIDIAPETLYDLSVPVLP
ncbi:DUF2442 domain-containing protein [Rhodoferax sp.]|uniref:DUF2442 domain-containing protein n=1 Tax=Rhodoferax sp. TaxID=50421 RepID=UPI0026279F49|nr:DUF2442 domain-containing protein [Rhodoferax sp.]MDD5480157.1 DUF2442 domain-containing protein [Rhodoferax sp.]